MQYLRAVFLPLFCGIFLAAGACLAQEAAAAPQSAMASLAAREVAAARAEIAQVQDLVRAGALPAVRLKMAEDKLADAQDDEILGRTLYGKLGLDELTPGDADAMIAAAQRRVDRQRAQAEQIRKLVADGVMARSPLDGTEEELRSRETALALARSRAELLEELAEEARRELAAENAEPLDSASALVQHFPGNGRFDPKELKAIVLAFQKKFDQPLPISARGETAVHRALGFDHRGRVDVALSPDAPEGHWLLRYLHSKDIPFYAFRAAVPGKATGAHIHIGPGSTRLHAAD